MRYGQWINVGFKTLGMYWLVDGFMGAVEYLVQFFAGPDSVVDPVWKSAVIQSIFINMLSIAIGSVFVLRTQSITKILKINDDQAERGNTTSAEVNYEALAFSLLGFYFAVPALSLIIPLLIWASQNTYSYDLRQDSQFAQMWVNLLGRFIQLVIGVALIIGRNKLAYIWRRLRPLSDKPENQ